MKNSGQSMKKLDKPILKFNSNVVQNPNARCTNMSVKLQQSKIVCHFQKQTNKFVESFLYFVRLKLSYQKLFSYT